MRRVEKDINRRKGLPPGWRQAATELSIERSVWKPLTDQEDWEIAEIVSGGGELAKGTTSLGRLHWPC